MIGERETEPFFFAKEDPEIINIPRPTPIVRQKWRCGSKDRSSESDQSILHIQRCSENTDYNHVLVGIVIGRFLVLVLEFFCMS